MSEKGQKAQLARMMKASLPNDWSYEAVVEVMRDYAQRNFVSKGMCADWAIHDSENDKRERNLHVHILLTLRPLEQDGKWGAKSRKVFDLDENGERVQDIVSAQNFLERNGITTFAELGKFVADRGREFDSREQIFLSKWRGWSS